MSSSCCLKLDLVSLTNWAGAFRADWAGRQLVVAAVGEVFDMMTSKGGGELYRGRGTNGVKKKEVMGGWEWQWSMEGRPFIQIQGEKERKREITRGGKKREVNKNDSGHFQTPTRPWAAPSPPPSPHWTYQIRYHAYEDHDLKHQIRASFRQSHKHGVHLWVGHGFLHHIPSCCMHGRQERPLLVL